MMREKLITDMTLLANEGRWEEHVYDLLIEILELRPDNPYVYLHHK